MKEAKQGNSNKHFAELSARLIHDVSTPAAVVKMNSEFIARYLPLLLASYRTETSADPEHIEIPREHLDAIEKAPALIEEQATLIEERIKAYWQTVNREFVEGAGEDSAAVRQQPERVIGAAESLHILLVEDEAVHQDIALKLLGTAHHLDIAASGSQAIEKCQAKPYDLVLMDICLPDLDGRQTIKTLRQSSSDLPVLALSNLPMNEEELHQNGFDAHLSKPLTLEAFTQYLRSARRGPRGEN